MSAESNEAVDREGGFPLPDCGERVSVESPRHEEKLWTQMIGCKPGAYLVLEKPAGADAVEGRHALRDGDSLVIRFLKDGSIFGFRTPILSTLSVPYKLLFVGYPVDVAQHSLRSSPRLQCYLPCDGHIGGRAFSRAFIHDLSATGCQLRIPLDALPDEAVPEDEGDPEHAEEALDTDEGDELEALLRLDEQPSANRILLNLQVPGEDEVYAAEGDVVEWQSQAHYYVVRMKFDEPQLHIFEQLSLYTT